MQQAVGRHRVAAERPVDAVQRGEPAAGLDHAMIGVDADSPTGAADLYRRLGFVEEAREVSWAVPL